MTRERLESYKSMKEEMVELQYKLAHLGEAESDLVGNSVINDYRSGYPVPQSVVGVDRQRYYRLWTRYVNRLEKLDKECDAIEEYIENIGDSLTRRILRMYFLEGKTQKEISKTVHLDKSNVSRKIEKILKSQRTQQTQHYNNT